MDLFDKALLEIELRDRMAIAAMGELIARGADGAEFIAGAAYRVADAMLEERRPWLDAVMKGVKDAKGKDRP